MDRRRRTWRQGFVEHIRQATADLPADAGLDDWIERVDASRPYHVNQTSHGKKAWQAARRDILVLRGYRPRTKVHKEREQRVMKPLPLFDPGGPE
jgi:hypothetical protein